MVQQMCTVYSSYLCRYLSIIRWPHHDMEYKHCINVGELNRTGLITNARALVANSTRKLNGDGARSEKISSSDRSTWHTPNPIGLKAI